MLELDGMQIALAVLAAVLIGFSKTGIPTLGILVVALMATIFPARESIGIVLPMLIVADLVAVTYYRRSVVWKTLFSLLPWVLGGIALGYVLLSFIPSDRYLEIVLGGLILALITVQVTRQTYGTALLEALPSSKIFVGVMGTLSGFATMIGNAAGPIMSLFLLVIALPKKEFIGTGAWFFLTVNLIKVPLYAHLGLITGESLTFNAWLIPAILIGTFVGIRVLPRIPQKHFSMIVLVLACLGGIRLLFP